MNLNGTSLSFLKGARIRPSLIFGVIIFVALIAFEMFNYSTTEYALRDLLGSLKFAGVTWGTILTIAFCGIDFAGIARLFMPHARGNAQEVWYLFGAWLLAATMNAALTWWGVSMAIANHAVKSASVISSDTISNIVPVFVAVMVWVIRILIIGSISYAADHLMGVERRPASSYSPSSRPRPLTNPAASFSPQPNHRTNVVARPVSTPINPPISRAAGLETTPGRPEPTYHSLTGSARPAPTNVSDPGPNQRLQ